MELVGRDPGRVVHGRLVDAGVHDLVGGQLLVVDKHVVVKLVTPQNLIGQIRCSDLENGKQKC